MSKAARPRASGSRWSRLYAALTGRNSQLLLVGAILGGIIGYLIGLNLAYVDISAARALVQQVRNDNQELKVKILAGNAKEVALQAEVAKAAEALAAVAPAENTFKIKPNESVNVAGGRLKIGLVGSPGIDSIVVNINGQSQTVVSGDIIHLSPVPSVNCQIRIRSFDMFEAVLNASCTETRVQ